MVLTAKKSTFMISINPSNSKFALLKLYLLLKVWEMLALASWNPLSSIGICQEQHRLIVIGTTALVSRVYY